MKRFLEFFASMSLQGKVATVLLGTCLAWRGILAGKFIYADDRVRVFTHTSLDQGVQGRFLNDVFYNFFSQGLFVDISPLSRVLCLGFIILAGYLLIHFFEIKKRCEQFWPFLPLFPAVFPFYAALLMYRFDSPGFGISLFFSVMAFGCAIRKNTIANILAIFLLFMALCVYQIFLNAFLVLSCFYVVFLIMENEKFSIIAKSLAKCLFIALGACAMYLPIAWHARRAALRPFADLPSYPGHTRFETILNNEFYGLFLDNISNYFSSILQYFGNNFLAWFLIGIGLLALASLFWSKASYARKMCALFMLALAFVSAAALNLVLKSPEFSPRTCIVFSIFAFMLFLFVISSPLWKKIPGIAPVSAIAACLYFFMATSSLSMIANAFEEQRQFENAVILEPLYLDFSELAQKRGRISYTATGRVPLNYSYKVIQEKFGFMGISPSDPLFVSFSLVSYFPADYLLAPNTWPDKTKYPVIKKRLYYEIREVSPTQYFIIFDAAPAPRNLKKFQTPYKFTY